MVEVLDRKVKSTDGVHTLYGKVYMPQAEPKGIFQIVHGMAEHIGRYESIMTQLAEDGWLVIGHNHIGHAYTSEKEEYGYFGPKNDYKVLVDDVNQFYNSVVQYYPGKKHFLMGHSMGSFIARLTASTYPETIDALIIMGTGGKNPASGAGLAVSSLISFFTGKKHVSKFIENMAFGAYNKRTENRTSLDWLTRDKDIVDRDLKDETTNYPFTVSGMHELVRMNRDCNLNSWYEGMDKEMPIYIISGTEDPVGDYGKGPKEVYEKLKQYGYQDVTLDLREGDRHEVLNELDKEQVSKDLIKWADSKVFI
jgi:alpha-beta hydrolase superfamily lysophospholipase